MLTLSPLVNSLEKCHNMRRVTSVAWSWEENVIASGDDKGNICIHDALNGRMVATLTSHRDNIKKLVWGWRGAFLASCSTDRFAMVWSLDRGCEWKDLGEDMDRLYNSQLRGHQGEVTCAAFHSDGITVATSSLDCTVRFWLSGGQNIRGTLRHESQVTSVAYSNSGLVLVTGTKRHGIRVWRFSTNRGSTGSDMWNDGGQHRAKPYKETTNLIDGREKFFGISIECLCCIREDTIMVGLGTRETPLGILHLRRNEQGLARNASIKHAPGLHYFEVPDVEEGKGHQNWIVDIATSPSGKHVATAGDDNRVILWEIYEWEDPEGRKPNPLGDFRKREKEQEVLPKECITPLGEVEREHSHKHYVTGVSFSGNGNEVASSSSDTTVKLWDVPAGASLARHSDLEEDVALLFSVAALGGHQQSETAQDKLGQRPYAAAAPPLVSCLGGVPELVRDILGLYSRKVGVVPERRLSEYEALCLMRHDNMCSLFR